MRKKYPSIVRVLVVLAMVVTLTGVLAVAPVSAQDCGDVYLSGTAGPVGTSITVTVNAAIGEWENQPVAVTFDGTAMATSPAAVAVDQWGAANCQVQIPATIAGEHFITVSVGYDACMFAFEVQPKVVISPLAGPSGTAATVTGSGFGAAVPVTVMVTIGGVPFAIGVPIETDPAGSFEATGTIPAGLAAGPQDIYAIDGAANEALKVDGFTVTPKLDVSPVSGLAGSAVTIIGSGWNPLGGNVDLWFGGQFWTNVSVDLTGSIYETGVTTLTTTPSGAMAVQGVQGSNTAATNFTVLPRQMGLTPSSGPMGITVTVTCSSLTPGGTVAIGDLEIGGAGWNDKAIEITTGGALTPTTLKVPNTLTVGDNTALLTDSGGLQASGIYTVTQPTVAITPATGPAGSSVTAQGAGWVPSSAIQLNFAGAPMTVYADNNGNIAAALVVPAVAAGQYYLTAQDILGNAAVAAGFIVPGAAITVDPVSGSIGGELTISGSGFQGYSGVTIKIGTYKYPITPLTSPLGAFQVTITVPGVAPGSQVITAEDGVGTQATTFFIVETAPETVETALASIMDELVIVWDYAAGDWLFYDPADVEGSDLPGLVKGTGYWIMVNADCTLIFGGHSYSLTGGWNNVGWLGR